VPAAFAAAVISIGLAVAVTLIVILFLIATVAIGVIIYELLRAMHLFLSSRAVSVPCGFSKDGLPIGMQLLGRPMEEEVILRLGHGFEQATEWYKRRPPIKLTLRNRHL
jgi:hypothetical protein